MTDKLISLGAAFLVVTLFVTQQARAFEGDDHYSNAIPFAWTDEMSNLDRVRETGEARDRLRQLAYLGSPLLLAETEEDGASPDQAPDQTETGETGDAPADTADDPPEPPPWANLWLAGCRGPDCWTLGEIFRAAARRFGICTFPAFDRNILSIGRLHSRESSCFFPVKV